MVTTCPKSAEYLLGRIPIVPSQRWRPDIRNWLKKFRPENESGEPEGGLTLTVCAWLKELELENQELRSAAKVRLTPCPPKIAEIRIESHRRAIRRHKAGLDDIPQSMWSHQWPVGSSREDRRRTKRQQG